MKTLRNFTLAITMGMALAFTASQATAQYREKPAKVYKQKKYNDRYDRSERYEKRDRYNKNNRYDRYDRNDRYHKNKNYKKLPPGQAKKIYGGQATDYAPGQVKKNNQNYDRRSRTVWDDIFGSRRR